MYGKPIGQISDKITSQYPHSNSNRKGRWQRLQQTEEDKKAAAKHFSVVNKKASADMRDAADFLERAGKNSTIPRVRQACFDARARLTHDIRETDRVSAFEGGFTMLGNKQATRVWDAIDALDPKYRPNLVHRVFDRCAVSIEYNTGKILIDRHELADVLDVHPDRISAAFGVLCRLQVFERRQKGRGFDYWLNPLVGWKGTPELHKEAARKATPPQKVLPFRALKRKNPPSESSE